MNCTAHAVESTAIDSMRDQWSAETDAQIVHYQMHRRAGWLENWELRADGQPCGFASIAIAGPWKNGRTALEFFVLPGTRHRTFRLFEAFLDTARPDSFEFQTNCGVEGVLPHVYGLDVVSEKIVFRDGQAPDIHLPNALLRPLTADDDVRTAMNRREGGGEWEVELNGKSAGRGGLLFHYNAPYGDIWMDIDPPFRRQGAGSWLVQQLMHEAHRLGATPAARCNPDNTASRHTLQKAGFVPAGHILKGRLSP